MLEQSPVKNRRGHSFHQTDAEGSLAEVRANRGTHYGVRGGILAYRTVPVLYQHFHIGYQGKLFGRIMQPGSMAGSAHEDAHPDVPLTQAFVHRVKVNGVMPLGIGGQLIGA